MGGKQSSGLDDELTTLDLDHLKAETGFTTRHLRRLFMRFRHLDRGNRGYLEKEDLMLRLNEVSCAKPRDCYFLK
jgi:Ca2+-binding EF-hand superfamily protein